jgi:hypothetical protein
LSAISNSVTTHTPASSGVSRDRQCCPVKSNEPESLIAVAMNVDGLHERDVVVRFNFLLARDKEMPLCVWTQHVFSGTTATEPRNLRGPAFMPYVVLMFFMLTLASVVQAADVRMCSYVTPIFVLLGSPWYFNRQSLLQYARSGAWTTKTGIKTAETAEMEIIR